MDAEETAQQEEHRRIVRERMERARVTNLEIAAMIGVAPENLSRMLTGTLPITTHRFGQILEAVALLHRDRCCTGSGHGEETTTEDE